MPSKQCPVTPNSFWMANPVLNTGHFTSYMGMEHHGTHDMGPMGPAKKNVDHLIWYPFKAWWLFNTFHPNMWLFCSLNHYNELFGSVLWAGQRFCDLWIQLPFTDRTVLRCAVICRRGANAGAFLGSTGWNGQDETLLLTGAWYEIGNWSIISIFTIIPFPIPYWAAVIKSFWKKTCVRWPMLTLLITGDDFLRLNKTTVGFLVTPTLTTCRSCNPDLQNLGPGPARRVYHHFPL